MKNPVTYDGTYSYIYGIKLFYFTYHTEYEGIRPYKPFVSNLNRMHEVQNRKY